MSDFTWVPDYTVASDTEFKTQTSEFESGAKQYRQVWSSAKRTWKLTFRNRTTAVMQAIQAFFESKLGQATSFTWTCPLDSVEYTVRFAKDKFSYDYVSYGLCDCEIELTTG